MSSVGQPATTGMASSGGSKARDWAGLALCILIALAPGVIVGVATSDEVATWFTTINRPPIMPPNWLFGPVWTVLYVLIGISLWRAWRATPAGRERTVLIVAFAVQLVLNTLWSLLFFQWRNFTWALVELILLWVSILVLMRVAGRFDRTAMTLLIPYLAWVTFAGILNFSFILVN